MKKYFWRLLCVLFVFTLYASVAQAEPLRLFVIGNSFSRNATQYLPELAKEGGHELIIGRAELGGCNLKEHWERAAAEIANPNDPYGSPYSGTDKSMARLKTGGKSLRQLLAGNKWDVITMQQASIYSGALDSYRPYARNLYDFVHKLQPQAKIVFHETWPYRSDSRDFTRIDGDIRATDQQSMWEHLHQAYYTEAADLGIAVIPNGDAFWKVDSDPKWGYKKDPNFDISKAVEPALPDQTHSLNGGYWWSKGKLRFDSHHANTAGRYLGALVWYGFLFNESPEKLTFVPEGVPADFAAQLRKVAWQVVQDNPRPLK